MLLNKKNDELIEKVAVGFAIISILWVLVLMGAIAAGVVFLFLWLL